MGQEWGPSPIRTKASRQRRLWLDKPATERLSQPISHGGERRRWQGRGGEDDVAAGVRVLHGPAHRSREGIFSLSLISRLLLNRLVIGMDGGSVAGGGDIGGVGDERQEPGEAGQRHRQPQVHRRPGWCFSSVPLLLLAACAVWCHLGCCSSVLIF